MVTTELPLSPREKQPLRRFAAGKADAQIAGHFGGDTEQVAKQRARLLTKPGARRLKSLTQLNGWLHTDVQRRHLKRARAARHLASAHACLLRPHVCAL